MLELGQSAEVARAENNLLRPGRGAEGDGDPAFLVGRVLLAAEIEVSIGDRLVRLVENREQLPGRARFRDEAQPSLANQRPAALAVANEVDDVHSRARERLQLKVPPHA